MNDAADRPSDGFECSLGETKVFPSALPPKSPLRRELLLEPLAPSHPHPLPSPTAGGLHRKLIGFKAAKSAQQSSAGNHVFF